MARHLMSSSKYTSVSLDLVLVLRVVFIKRTISLNYWSLNNNGSITGIKYRASRSGKFTGFLYSG